MQRGNVVPFPVANPISDGRTPGDPGKIRSVSHRSISWLRRFLRNLMVAAAWKAVCLVAIAVVVCSWLGRLMFGVLSLGFLGKLWLHWGTKSAWVSAMELGASLLIFCVLSALLAWLKRASPATPAPVARLSLWDRLLLVSRR